MASSTTASSLVSPRFEPIDRDSDRTAHAQVRDKLRALAIGWPWDQEPLLPAEPVLMQRFDVSRGTLRRATADLARDGLLRGERGRGTFVSREHQVRLTMVDVLEPIAIPDSRWDMDVTRFVPDFEGSLSAIRRLCGEESYEQASTLFVAPDNSLRQLISIALADGKDVVVPTYGLRRGFVLLTPSRVKPSDRDFAATLDGLERFGDRLALDDLRATRIDMMVTGAQAVSADGRHFGIAEGFFEVEWALLSSLGTVGDDTCVACVVHDVQVLPVRQEWSTSSVPVDVIATPTRRLEPKGDHPRPRGLVWSEFPASRTANLAYVDDLRPRDAGSSHQQEMQN